MAHISGTVNKIYVNSINQDQFGNCFKHTVYLKNVEGAFYFGSSKSEDLYLKSTGEIRVGDTIEFMFEENGKYKNVKRATVIKNSAAESKGSLPLRKSKSQGGESYSTEYDDRPIGPVIGQCLNFGIDLGIIDINNTDDPNAIRNTIIAYRRLKRQIYDLWDAADKEPQPFVDESPQEQFDDDIPF